MAVTDWFIALPALPLAIALAAVLGQGDASITIAIAVTSWPGTARLIRAQTLAVEARPFIERAKALGARDSQLMARQVLPNVTPFILVSATLTVASAILSETTLTFLGLGNPTDVSWGSMINQAFNQGAVTSGAWWYILPPGVAILDRGAGIHPGRARGGEHPQPEDGGRADDGTLAGLAPPAAPLLEVRDLAVTYRTGDAAVPAVRGVSLTLTPGRRSAWPASPAAASPPSPLRSCAAAARSAKVTGQILFQGEDVLTMSWGKLRAVRWAGASIIFQGAMHSLNPVQRIGKQIAEPILLHDPGRDHGAGQQAGRRAAQSGRRCRPARADSVTRTSFPAARSSG